MSAIGPGDFVECVSAGPLHLDNYPGSVLTLGGVYQVADCGFDIAVEADVVWLVGVRSLDFTGSFYAKRFRPIYRPKAELIESLLAPAPAAPAEPDLVQA